MSNISLRELNNNFNDDVELVDGISLTLNNISGETIDTSQTIAIKKPIDFNNGIIANTEPVELVTDADLVFRQNYNMDTRSIAELKDIEIGNNLGIKAGRPITLLQLIKLSAQSNTTIDIIDSEGIILRTVTDINDILYSENNIKYIIENINNNFEGTMLDNYTCIKDNKIPATIDDNGITISDTAPLNYILLTFSNIDWESVFIPIREGSNKTYKFTVGLRFNIDTVKTFPITYPLINTSFNNDQLYSDPIMIDFFIKSGSTDLINEFEEKRLNSVFLYI